MRFVEFPPFSKAIEGLLTETEYSRLCCLLADHPDIGAVIPGMGGIRKMRYGLRGKGKRGGMRVIYYWVLRGETILLLYAYAKNAQADLTESQKKTLRRLIKE